MNPAEPPASEQPPELRAAAAPDGAAAGAAARARGGGGLDRIALLLCVDVLLWSISGPKPVWWFTL
jgi:hypothetical protein